MGMGNNSSAHDRTHIYRRPRLYNLAWVNRSITRIHTDKYDFPDNENPCQVRSASYTTHDEFGILTIVIYSLAILYTVILFGVDYDRL